MKAKRGQDEAFDQGYFCAIATLIRGHGESGVEEDLIGCNMLKSFAHIDEYDMEVLMPIIKRMKFKAKAAKKESRR